MCKRDITWPTIKGYEIDVIVLPTQHPVQMAFLFSFLKFPPTSTFHSSISCVFFSNDDGSFHKIHSYLLWQVHLVAKHLDSTNITMFAAVSLDVERTAPSSNFVQKCNFYTDISILAAVSQDVESTAPSSIFFKNVISILTYRYWLRSATMLSVQPL